MKTLLSILVIATTANAISQITITEADFATANDTVTISSSDETNLDLVTTGANSTWDFSTINIETQRVDTFYDVSDADALYQFVFNNGFTNPDYESEYFLPWGNVDFSQADQIGLEIKDPLSFTKISSSMIEIVGYGVTANGYAIPAASDTIDIKYHLPMNFSDSWYSRSYTNLDLNPAFDGIYRRYQQRTSEVDGWGEITTPFKTYSVIRVKSYVESQDSVYVNFGGFGGQWFEMPVPPTYEYEWYANGEDAPVFKVITQDIGGTEEITTVEFKDKKRDFASVQKHEMQFGVYPNPAKNDLIITSEKEEGYLNILSLNGELISSQQVTSNQTTIDISGLSNGLYFVQLQIGNKTSVQKFSVVK
ncbi:MAG: T9SS type A sorting domain-containing protein [Crocinitomicaceae bacterium]